MPRLTIKELEAKIRKVFPTFGHVEFNGGHYISRWSTKLLSDSNILGRCLTYRGALNDALAEMKRERK